jgi:structural maintenance of chromosome 1
MSLWKRYVTFKITRLALIGNVRKSLRGDAVMDVDEDEEGTQRPKQVQDYGIEVDFSSLEDDERTVRFGYANIQFSNMLRACLRMARQMLALCSITR